MWALYGMFDVIVIVCLLLHYSSMQLYILYVFSTVVAFVRHKVNKLLIKVRQWRSHFKKVKTYSKMSAHPGYYYQCIEFTGWYFPKVTLTFSSMEQAKRNRFPYYLMREEIF